MLFDFDNDGIKEQISWTSAYSDDAWLVLDRNGNGFIDNGLELFGNTTPQIWSTAPNGFIALSEYDRWVNGGNDDGELGWQDLIFSDLRLWQDVNHEGVSQENELRSLSSLGLKSISLDYRRSRRIDHHGNEFRYRTKVRDVRGAHFSRWAWDVFLVSD